MIISAVAHVTGHPSGFPALIAELGVKGVLVLLAVGAILLTWAVGKTGRKLLAKLITAAIRKGGKFLVRYVRITLWAARKRMPLRLAVRLQPERWRQMCEARKLTGLKRGRVKRTPMGVDVRVTLGGALSVETLQARIKDLETGLGTRRGAIRIEAVPEAAHKAIVRITVRNPLARAVRWPRPVAPVSIKDPAKVSMTPFGEWVDIDLQQRILIVGASGSGKSSTQRVLAAPVVLAADADLEVWDLKQGTESQHYEGKADVRITTAESAKDRLTWFMTSELPRRAAVMKARKTSTWPTSPENRDRVVMVDEGAALIRELDDDELPVFFTFLEQARAFGIYVWWATQFPKATNLPSEIRSQMSAVLGLKMRRASESRVVFEDLTKEGWTPHRLPGKGWVLVLDDDHDEPEESRVCWIDEREFQKLTPETPELLPAPVHAAIEAAPAAVVPPMPTYDPDIPAVVSLVKPEEAAPAAEELPTPDAVLAALADAPVGGMGAAGLILATGRGKTQVYAAITQLQDDGKVVKVGHGKYALNTAAKEA